VSPSVTRRGLLALLAGATTSGCAAVPGRSSVPTRYDHPAYAASATDTGTWPQFGHDAARTGAGDSPAPTGDVGGAWLRTAGEGGTTAPVVDDDAVYLCAGGHLVAYDAVAGTERWRAPVAGGDVRDAALVGDAVVTLARTRTEAATTTLCGHTRADGATRWSVSLPGRPTGPLAVVDDVAYVAGEADGAGWAVAVGADGRERWRRDLDVEPFSGVVGDGDGLFVVSVTDRVVALDTDGGERWRRQVAPAFETGERPNLQGLPAVDDDRLYAPGVDGRLYAVERADGRAAWTATLVEESKSNALPSPAVVDDTVYVNTYHAGLVAVGADGTRRWATGKPGGLHAPVAGPDTLLAPGRSAVRAYGRDGDARWTFELPVGDAPGSAGYAMAPQLALARGLLYVTLLDGRVYAVGSASS
jgi:outer membrane protein assembly factor BamB